MELFNFILDFLLLFSNDILLMLISTMIYIVPKKDDYKQLVLLLLFVMVFKTFLKDLFKIPLPVSAPSLNYAFPSGHIYFSTVFYFWIAFYKQSLKFGVFASIVLFLTSFSIIFKGYHYFSEVIFTFLFGIATIFIFNKLFVSIKERLNMFLFISCILYILYVCVFEKSKIDSLIGAYGTIGFILGSLLNQVHNKIFTFLFSILGLISFYIFTPDVKDFIKGVQWSFIFFMPPCIRFIKDGIAKYLSNF